MVDISQPVRIHLSKKMDLYTIVIEQPTDLAGLTLAFSPHDVTISYDTIQFSVAATDIPQSSIFVVIYELLSTTQSDAILGTNEEFLTLSGKTGLIDYEMQWDATGDLVKILFPNIKTSVAVSDFVIVTP